MPGRQPFLLLPAVQLPPPRGHHLRPLERAWQPLHGPWPLCTCAEDASCPPFSVPEVSETTGMCNSISYQLVSVLRLAFGWGTPPLPLLHLQTPTHPSSPSSKAAFARKPSLTTSPQAQFGWMPPWVLTPPRALAWGGPWAAGSLLTVLDQVF